MSEITVKTLEWDQYNIDMHKAETFFGYYVVAASGQCWLKAGPSVALFESIGKTVNAAKAACQSDFDARIRSALVERRAEPVAYASSKEWRKNHLMSAAQYKSALSKNTVDFDIPLHAHPPTALGTVTEEMRVAACRALNERGQGNAITICDVVAMLEAALSAAPEPVTEEGGGNAVPQTLDEIIENSLRMWYFNYDPSLDHTAARIAMREIIRYVIDVARVSPASPSPVGDRDALIERLDDTCPRTGLPHAYWPQGQCQYCGALAPAALAAREQQP